MLRLGRIAEIEEGFVDQFEGAGAGYVYRRNMRDAPIRISAAERERFVATFTRRSQLLSQAFVGAALLAVVLGAAFKEQLPEYWLLPAVAILVAAFWLVYRRIWNAPAAELERRAPVGQARSRAEVRNRMISWMSWPHVLGAIALMSLTILTNVPIGQPMDMMHWLMLIFGIFGLASALLVAIRKLRLPR